MEVFDLSLEILLEVIEQKKPFSDALKDKFVSDIKLRPLRSQVAGLVGCELRHHILFEYLLKDIELEVAERSAVELVLANDYFYHRFDKAELDGVLKEKIGEEKFQLVSPVIENYTKPEEYVPLSVKRNSQPYLSLRYNVPAWILKVFAHFPYFQVYRTIKKYSRPVTTTLRAREGVDVNALVASNNFAATKTEGILSYVGKESLRRNEVYRSGKLFAEKELTKIIFDEHRVSEPSEVLLYNGNADTSLEKELIESYGSSLGMNIAVPEVDARPDVTSLIKEKGLRNVNFFSAPDPQSMQAAISSQQDLVIVAPNSSNFDLAPTSPDYLLNFSRDTLTGLIENQKKVLEGCSKYVEVGGKLLYLVYTLNMKEGPEIIANFIKQHEDFTIISEHQYLPYESHQTTAYLAVLEKKEKELSIAPALNEIASTQAQSQNVASASSK